MIEQIRIAGYKCLKAVTIDTSNLNVLVGPNASGKSSVLQCLLLLRQSADKDGGVNALHLSGPLFEGGTIQDVLHPAAEHTITIGLQIGKEDTLYSFRLNRDDDTQTPRRILAVDRDDSSQLPLLLRDRGTGFAYLSAERVGPRVTYPLPPDDMHLSGRVGKQGEFTGAVLARAQASSNEFIDGWSEDIAALLSNAPQQLDGQDLIQELAETQGRLDLVCNLMLRWIIPGSEFIASEHDQTDAASVRFIRDPLSTRASVRATHIGFGLSYTLPIITAGLAVRRDGLLLVENPEAHLHPFSQSRIGVFLALMAATGRQVFIETHSDHVVNGIRLAVRCGAIPPDQVYFHSFMRPVSDNTATVTQIRVNANGRLDQWPQSFFDQIENDLSKL